MHDWFAFGIWIAVLGHIFFAVRDRDSLEAMWQGAVAAPRGRRAPPRRCWHEEAATRGAMDNERRRRAPR